MFFFSFVRILFYVVLFYDKKRKICGKLFIFKEPYVFYLENQNLEKKANAFNSNQKKIPRQRSGEVAYNNKSEKCIKFIIFFNDIKT